MAKVPASLKTLLYPMPAFMVAAHVNSKPNFTTVAWSGIGGSTPPIITVALQHRRHTLIGIKQNMTFSVNVPSTDQVRETDFCGTNSGSKTDKVTACGFKIFYGKLTTAPLIEQCPINLECKVLHILDVGSHALIVGQIEETYIEESCVVNGKADIDKVKPIVYSPQPVRRYYALGKVVADAYSIGKELMPNSPA